MDNAQLQKRYIKVAEDLDRMKAEREILKQEMRQIENDNKNINRLLNQKDEIDMENIVLKEDVDKKREANRELEDKLHLEQLDSAEANIRISTTNKQRQNLKFDAHNLNNEFEKKTYFLEEMKKKRDMSNADIIRINQDLEMYSLQEHEFNYANIDLNTQVAQLQSERHNLLTQLHQITKSLDECMEDTQKIQSELDEKQRWHRQLISAKIIEQTLRLCKDNQRQQCFTEIRDYSSFDKACHQKLKRFAKVIYILGNQIQKDGLARWYRNSLKSIHLRDQNYNVVGNVQNSCVKAKVFHALKNYQEKKKSKYIQKSDAVQRSWFLLDKSRKYELKRAMQLWKEKSKFDKTKLQIIQKLCSNSRTGQLWHSMNKWKEYNKRLEFGVRIHLLKESMVNKQLLQNIFGQIRAFTSFQRKKRLHRLRLCLKAWKDFQTNKRYLILQNMSTLRFLETNNKMTLKLCFNVLKIHKETKKQKLLKTAIEKDLDVAIQKTQEKNLKLSKQVLKSSQKRSCMIVRDLMGKQLFSYWNKWIKETQWKSDTLNRKHKDRIIRIYLAKLKKAFLLWQISLNYENKQKRYSGVNDLGNNIDELQNQALANEQELRQCEEYVRTSKRLLIEKLARRLHLKREHLALKIWKLEVDRKILQQKHLLKAIIKWSHGLLGDALKRFKRSADQIKQEERNEIRKQNFIQLIEFKQKTQLFNAICFYSQRQKLAKRYWSKILTRMDNFMRQRALNIWLQNANLLTQENLDQRQSQLTQILQEENKAIQQIEQHKKEQIDTIGSKETNKIQKAHKKIGNYIMRHYSDSTKLAFSTWKDRVRDSKHKQQILKAAINQMRRITFSDFRRRFQQFRAACRQSEKNKEIKDKQLQQTLTIQAKQCASEQHTAKVQQLQAEIDSLSGEISKRNIDRDKVLQFLERRNQDQNFMSRKRLIFLSWNNITKQQTSALRKIEFHLKKFVLLKCIHEIQTVATNKNNEFLLNKILHMRVVKRQKRFQSDAFSRWKNACLKKADQRIKQADDTLQNHEAEFNELIDKVKEVNTQRCLKVFMDINKANVMRAWLNAARGLNKLKQAGIMFQHHQKFIQKKFVTKFWFRRLQATKNARQMEKIVKDHTAFSRYKYCFYTLKKQWKNTKSLATRLGGLEHLLQSIITQDAFKNIKSFSKSKTLVQGNSKYIGTYDLMRCCRQAYIKNLRAAFYKYREKIQGAKVYKQDLRLKQTFGKFATQNLRFAFTKWKNINNKITMMHDLYSSGPCRAEDWEAKREIQNLTQFMKDENFTQNEIHDFFKNNVVDRNQFQMRKYILQWRAQGQENGILVYCLDRWKKFTRIRKLVKHTLRFCNNKTTDVKSDLQYAFNKWKNDNEKLETVLCRLPYQKLLEMGIRSTNEVNNCAEMLETNAQITGHLTVQRDEFLNFYIKGQKLAMALIKDGFRKAECQAWSRWFAQQRNGEEGKITNEMRDAAYLKASLNQKKSQLIENNTQVDRENNELSGFKGDKPFIKKQLETIKQDWSRVKNELDQTEEIFQELLDENQRLKRLIEEAEKKKNDDGPNPKFLNNPTVKEKKQEENKSQKETEEQKKTRERFEKLSQIQASSSIR